MTLPDGWGGWVVVVGRRRRGVGMVWGGKAGVYQEGGPHITVLVRCLVR